MDEKPTEDDDGLNGCGNFGRMREDVCHQLG